MATFSHQCEGLLICNVEGNSVPLLMRTIYLENKQLVGKVDDVFGTMDNTGIAIVLDKGAGA